MKGYVAERNEGYRHGMVLGLTMAEIMFLLVFVLLLLMTGILQSMKKEIVTLKETNAQLTRTLEATRRSLEDNRELIELAKKLRSFDVSPNLLEAAVQVVKEVSVSIKSENPLELVAVVRELLKQVNSPKPDFPEDWQTLVRMKAVVERLGGIELVEKKVIEHEVLQKELVEKERQLAEKMRDDLPPLIRLSEADGFHFQLGKSELSQDFDTFLRTKVVPLLLDMTKKYNVDVIEVVGHTDPVPMSGLQPSNLDAELRNTLVGSAQVATLTPADNAGLGMSRAVAVSRVLLENQQLKQLRIVPLSAAQLIDLNEQLDTTTKIAPEGQKERRRIEIRLRRATETQALKKDAP